MTDQIHNEQIRELHERICELERALRNLTETGEFYSWVVDQEMPWAAAKDVIEAQEILNKTQ